MGSPAFSFKGTNPAAQRVAERQAARFITLVTEETKQAIRALIARSIREGVPPYDAARAIRPMIGLNGPQAMAAANYRESLINLGHTPERVDSLLERFTEKKIRERAVTIARTETMEALNEGQRESWHEAQAEGLLGPDAQVEWITTPDEKLCPVCEPMDGVKVPLGEDFPVEGPPAHPRCRCTVAVLP